MTVIRIVEKYDPNQPRDPGGEGGGQWVKRGGGLASVNIVDDSDRPTPSSLQQDAPDPEDGVTPFQKRARAIVKWFNDHPIATNLIIAGASVASVLIAGALVNKKDPSAVSDWQDVVDKINEEEEKEREQSKQDNQNKAGRGERMTPEGTGTKFPKDSSYWGFTGEQDRATRGQAYFTPKNNAPKNPDPSKDNARPKNYKGQGRVPQTDSIDEKIVADAKAKAKSDSKPKVEDKKERAKWKEAIKQYDDDAWDDDGGEETVTDVTERDERAFRGGKNKAKDDDFFSGFDPRIGASPAQLDELDKQDEEDDRAIQKKKERRKKAAAKKKKVEEEGPSDAELEELELLGNLVEETGTNSPHGALGFVTHILDGNEVDNEIIEFNDLDYLDDGFDPDYSPKSIIRIVEKYDPNQPRDPGGEDGGQWVKLVSAGAGGPTSGPKVTDNTSGTAREKKAKSILNGATARVKKSGYELPDEIVMGSPLTWKDHLGSALGGAGVGGFIGAFWGPIGLGVGAASGAVIGSLLSRASERGILAAYHLTKGTMYFNTKADYWDNVEQTQREMFDAGWFSSPNKHHTVYHELAHHAHKQENEWSGRKAAREMSKTLRFREFPIAEKVSGYAGTQRGEFVAEVFAGHLAGQRFDQDVYDLYNEFGGPKLK